MFFDLVLPPSIGGDVVRAWYLDAHSGRRTDAFLSVLVDRGSGLLVLLALACGAALFGPIGLPEWIYWSVWGTAGAAGLGLMAAYVIGKMTRRRQEARLSLAAVRSHAERGNEVELKNANCQSGDDQPRQSIGNFQFAIFNLQSIYQSRPRLLLGTTLLSILIQAANVAIVWLVGLAIDVGLPPLIHGGDTGPLHLAAALRVPVVAIFGPTDPARNGPYRTSDDTSSVVLRNPVSPTSHARRSAPDEGMLEISAQAVVDAARRLLVGAGTEGAHG